MSNRVPSNWEKIVEHDPEHSARYAQRFRDLAASGQDLDGEARMIDAMLPRRARVLDAGCGPGRVGAYLHRAGHTVVGVDVDPHLIDEAGRDYPGPTWLVGDLAELDLPARGIAEGFDAIVCAGNVMTFLAPSTRVEVLRRLGCHLRVDTSEPGRLVIGFGADRDYDFEEFFADVSRAGLAEDLRLSTWDMRPFAGDSRFLVCVLRSTNASQGSEATAKRR